MSAAQIYLKSLNDCELSFVYIYRYKTYLEACGKQILDAEVARRKLSRLCMLEHVYHTEYQLSNTGCVRCNSARPLVNDICQVCHHHYRPNRVIPGDKPVEVEDSSWQMKLTEVILGGILEGLFS